MSDIERHAFAVPGAGGESVRAVVHVAPGGDRRPVVVVCHGFKGFKDWGCWPWLADQLAQAGCAAVRMDFSHNGVGDDPSTFERLDLFEADTIGGGQEDIAAVIGALRDGAVAGAERCDPARLGLVGHSRGGGSVLLYASEHADVRAVAGLAPVSSFLRLAPSQVQQWRAEGRFIFPNSRTGQDMPLGVAFLHELDGDPERFSIERACRRLGAGGRPLLVVHGSDDEAVPFFEGEAVVSWGGAQARLERVEGAGHTFGAKHPFEGPTPQLEQAAGALAAFFAEHLAG